MSALSTANISALAKEFTQFGKTVSDFVSSNDIASDELDAELTHISSQCSGIGMNLSLATILLDFSDANSAFQSLMQVTTDANNAAESLKNEVAQVSRGVAIGAAMLRLGGALTGGTVSTVVSALGNLHGAIWG